MPSETIPKRYCKAHICGPSFKFFSVKILCLFKKNFILHAIKNTVEHILAEYVGFIRNEPCAKIEDNFGSIVEAFFVNSHYDVKYNRFCSTEHLIFYIFRFTITALKHLTLAL